MIKRVLAGLLVIVAVGLALTSCGTVESGNVGVRTTLGKVNPESNMALLKFAERGGTTTVVLPANMQTAPLISIGK